MQKLHLVLDISRLLQYVGLDPPSIQTDAKLPLILVTQERIFRIAHASFGSTMTMITCVITVIVHTITGWVSNCLSQISCSTCMYTHSSSLCKYSAAQSIPTSVLAAEVIQKKALSVAVCMWDREACVFALVV